MEEDSSSIFTMKLLILFTLGCLASSSLGDDIPMPRFSWETFGKMAIFHSSNTTAPSGMYSPESIEILAKYAVVTIEKYQGNEGFFPHHKEINMKNCQDHEDVSQCGCCVEDNIEEVAQGIKAIDPSTMVFAYIHSQKAYPVYRGSQELAKHPDLWLRDAKGNIVHENPDETYMLWDHAQIESGQFLLDDCVNMVNGGLIDSCHLDGCTKIPHDAPDKDKYWEVKLDVMLDMQAKMKGPVICGANGHIVEGLKATALQNWGKNPTWSTREMPMLFEAVNAGVMFEAHFECPEDPENEHTINNIASFLIAAGPYSYFRCGGWSGYDPVWYPIYDYPIGEPLGNATLGEDGVWRRSFKSGTSVTFDTKHEKGTIDWATSF